MMSDPNIYISNGTCYSAAGKQLDGSFIPCGNDYYGHQTCCGAGDNCLADNSCFGFHGSGYGSYLTYMAGCSDPDYKDSSCPQKDIDQPWIALTLCDNSDGAWAACSQSGDPTTLQPGSYCSCTDAASATVQFRDSTSLTSSCSLPQSTGESIEFFAGHVPTASSASFTSTTAAATTSSSNTGPASSSATTTPSRTGSKTPSSGGTGAAEGGSTISTQKESSTSTSNGTGSGESGSVTSTQTESTTESTTSSPSGNATTQSSGGTSSGLSTGTKIGIGVGAGVGGLIILALIIALFVLQRKRRRSRSPIKSGSADFSMPPKSKTSDHQRVSAMSTTPTVWGPDDVSVADGGFAYPWNQRSELEGTQVVPNRAELPHDGRVKKKNVNYVPELPASTNF